MEEYITIHIFAGLGNQLFQLATAYAYSRNHNKKLNILKINRKQTLQERGTYWDTILEKFSKIIDYVKLDEKDITTYYEKSSRDYSEIPYFKGNVRLCYYFQSEKYFYKYRKELIDLIKPSYNCIKYIEIKYRKIIEQNRQHKNIGVIHVRRGDYVMINNGDILLSLNYYKKGMEYINSIKNIKNWIIFSDDTQWVKHQELFKNSIIINDKDYIELYLMTYFSYYIIANSTFSWWGAWLSQATDKIVIVPDRWEYDDEINDLINTEGFIKLGAK